MSTFRVVFCGTPEVAVPSLQALASDPAFEVVLVITQPDRPKGRGMNVQPSPVAAAAEELGLQVAKPDNINNSQFSILNSQFLVAVAYGQILKKEVLRLPTIAPINLHFSLLPRWRGASPVESAILAGDSETGVTVMEMVEALDAGPILAQERIPLSGDETAIDLKQRLATLGAELLKETLKQPLKRTPQPREGITICTRLQKQDGCIDLKQLAAEEIDRRVRALTPWPGVMATMHGRPLKLIATALQPTSDSIPLACAGGTHLYARTVQEAGKKAVSGAEWGRERNELNRLMTS